MWSTMNRQGWPLIFSLVWSLHDCTALHWQIEFCRCFAQWAEYPVMTSHQFICFTASLIKQRSFNHFLHVCPTRCEDGFCHKLLNFFMKTKTSAFVIPEGDSQFVFHNNIIGKQYYRSGYQKKCFYCCTVIWKNIINWLNSYQCRTGIRLLECSPFTMMRYESHALSVTRSAGLILTNVYTDGIVLSIRQRDWGFKHTFNHHAVDWMIR